jgi:hypothetical protein
MAAPTEYSTAGQMEFRMEPQKVHMKAAQRALLMVDSSDLLTVPLMVT